MPLRLAVGVNRKIGLPNFSSAGANLNLELEVDTSLLDRPDELQGKVRMLFKMTDAAVREEIARQLETGNGSGGPASPPLAVEGPSGAANGKGSTNGQTRATPKQVDLICKLAGERLAGGNGQLGVLCSTLVGAADVHHVTKAQASKLIEHLLGLPEHTSEPATPAKS
jgi:hypothetical protein